MGDGRGNGYDVLVVDDNQGDRRFIAEAVEASDLNLTVHTVETRDEALDVVSHQEAHEDSPEPAVVFLDWNLSRETSEEVVTAAKSGDSSISVIVMTGSESELQNVQSTLSQADMCIEKPTDPDGYVDPLRSLLPDH